MQISCITLGHLVLSAAASVFFYHLSDMQHETAQINTDVENIRYTL